MNLYRVFVGGWCDGDPEWTIIDETQLTWDAAKNRMGKLLSAFENDSCEFCRDDAVMGLRRLDDAEPGLFEAFVEGDDYIIAPEPPEPPK